MRHGRGSARPLGARAPVDAACVDGDRGHPAHRVRRLRAALGRGARAGRRTGAGGERVAADGGVLRRGGLLRRAGVGAPAIAPLPWWSGVAAAATSRRHAVARGFRAGGRRQRARVADPTPIAPHRHLGPHSGPRARRGRSRPRHRRAAHHRGGWKGEPRAGEGKSQGPPPPPRGTRPSASPTPSSSATGRSWKQRSAGLWRGVHTVRPPEPSPAKTERIRVPRGVSAEDTPRGGAHLSVLAPRHGAQSRGESR